MFWTEPMASNRMLNNWYEKLKEHARRLHTRWSLRLKLTWRTATPHQRITAYHCIIAILPRKMSKGRWNFLLLHLHQFELTNNSEKMILHEATKQKRGADDRRQIIKRKIFSLNPSSHKDIKRKCPSLLLQCRPRFSANSLPSQRGSKTSSTRN